LLIKRIFLRCIIFTAITSTLTLLLFGSHSDRASAAPEWSGATEFGIQIDTHYTDKIPNYSQLQQLRPEWVRGDYSQITFSPSWPASVKTLVLVNNETTRSSPPGSSTPFTVWKTYVDTVYVPKLEQIFQQSPAIPAIEVWNEEDICRQGFCPYVPPQEYAYLLDRAATIIKAISPVTKVIMGGMASGNIAYMQDVMRADAAGFNKIDAIGLHPYGMSPDGWCATGCAGGVLPFGDLARDVTNYQSVAQKPVWVTEIGTSSSNDRWQAQYLTRCFLVLERLRVPVMIWYAWIDTMTPYFGLMNTQGQMKPSAYAFRRFALRSTYDRGRI
jgi:hypothetical protein